MDNIAQNPYRVLGVFANDPLKTRTANTARIRAFNKVGKPCSFNSDLDEIFGKIDRSEEAIITAERQLSSVEDSEFYGLLWLHRSTHLPLSPSATADIVSSSISHDSFDDIINSIIGVLYGGNYDKAAELIIKLFKSQDKITENTKRRFLRYIIDSFDELPLSSWWSTFKNILIQDKIEQSTPNFLCDFFNAVSLSKLKILTEFGSIKRDNIEWKNIITVRSLANSLIEVVMESSNIETKQPNAESQIVLSGYAQAMLNACKKYYNSTRFWEAKPVLDILVVLREVYKISYSSKIKDECTEFGKKIKNETNYLAPNTVRKQALEIRKEIEAFCDKPNETKWSNVLINNCVRPLTEIRKQLGPNNLYYKRVSSQIANNALYACENEIERIYEIHKDSAIIVEVKEIIKQAVQLCANIKAFEVDDTFNTSKFKETTASLDLLCKKYNEKLIHDVPALFSFQSQDDFMNSNHDYNYLVNYLQNNPNGPHAATVKKRIMELEDKEYPNNETIDTLFAYKKKYPNSHNNDKVLQALNRLLLGMTIGTITEYQTLLSLFPNHVKRNVILGRIDLLTYKACKTLPDWEKYLIDFPNGQHVAEAKEKILQAKQSDVNFIFEQCKTIIDYNRFILKYPSSTLYEKAYNKIEDSIYQTVLASGKYEEYYKRFPNGRYISNLKSNEDDKKFQSCKTIEDYKSYVKSYPNGKNIVKANLIIEQNRTKKRNRFYLVAFIIAIVVTVIYLSNNNNGTNIQSNNYINQQSNSYSNQQASKNYKNNSLETGSKPYSSQFGSPLTGDNYFDFKTSSGHDYVVIIKTSYDNRYINHVYIRGGEKARLYVPDGNFDVYFYSGKGWNPNKKVNQFTGGFTTGGSMQKDGPVELYSAYMEYTLYPVTNGNLRLKGADVDDVFN